MALSDVRWRTDISLLRNSARILILGTRRCVKRHGVSGIRDRKDDMVKIRKEFNRV